jgi:hypothetical protein
MKQESRESIKTLTLDSFMNEMCVYTLRLKINNYYIKLYYKRNNDRKEQKRQWFIIHVRTKHIETVKIVRT